MKNKILGLGTLAIVGSSAFAIVACTEEAKKIVIKLTDEKNKIPDTLEISDSAKVAGSYDFTSVEIGIDVTENFQKLVDAIGKRDSNFAFYTSELAKSVEVTIKVKTAYNIASKELVLTFTIKNGSLTMEKNVTIKFERISLQAEIDKLQDIEIQKSVTMFSLDYDLPSQVANTNVKSEIEQVADLYDTSNNVYKNGSGKLLKSKLAASVSISEIKVKKKYDIASGKLVLTIKLTKVGKKIKTGTDTKDVTITFGGKDLTAEVDKLLAEITDVQNSKKGNFVGSAGSVITKSHYTDLTHLKSSQTLAPNVSVDEVKIKTATSGNKVVVTIKLMESDLSNGIKYGTNTKDVSITFLAR